VNEYVSTPINRWSGKNSDKKRPLRVTLALLLAVFLHYQLFDFLRDRDFFSQFNQEVELNTEQVQIDSPVEEVPELTPTEVDQTIPDFAEIQEEITDIDDILPELKNQDLDIRAEVKAPELSIKMSTPAKLGELDGVVDDIELSLDTQSLLDDLGEGTITDSIAAEGQVILEEGSVQGEVMNTDEIFDNKTLKGVGGLSTDGVMEGYSSLDALMSMSTINLQGARSALPSDLLFAFGSAELKTTARFGLMKLGMLIDRNPKMYCILEGHTDTIGSDKSNQQLSEERAQAVKDYLVNSLRLSPEKIIVIGFGESRPLVTTGDQNQQAPNRRVDILMRNQIPNYSTSVQRAQIIEDSTPTQRAELVE